MMIRCSKCNRLLFKMRLNGCLEYEIVCPKCMFKMCEEVQMNDDVRSFRSRELENKE